MRHVVAGPLLQHRHEPLVQTRIGVVDPQRLGLTQRTRRVQPLDQVPGGQVKKGAAGHFALLRPQVPVTQQGHHPLQAELLVKVGPTNVHAGGGQHIAGAVGQHHALRAQAHHGEVRCTATQVHHKHQALSREAPLVVQRRRNRLQLKRHLVKPDRLRRLLQRGLRQRVTLRVVVHKMHRPAHHHTGGRFAQRVGGAFAQRVQKGGHDVQKAHLLAVHLGFFHQQRTAQQAFERAHEPALGAAQVLRHGIAPEVCLVVFSVVKHRRGH